MPNAAHCLIVSNEADFGKELVDKAASQDFSAWSIRMPDGPLPLLLEHSFDWLVLDLALGEGACLQIIDSLDARPEAPRLVLIASNDRAAFDSVRLRAERDGLYVVHVLGRPLSAAALEGLLDQAGGLLQLDRLLHQLGSIPNEEIVVHYQPMITMADRTIRRVEALVRWRHSRYGLLAPALFIEHAERSGAIAPLTWEVLRRAIEQHVAWRTEGMLLSVAVNISALFLSSQEIADDILALLQDRDCDPRHLVLEITETEEVRDPSVARALLARLREAGVELSLDDYGVGFSNLERLHEYPFSELKVDRHLVAGLDRGHQARRTVEKIVSVAAKEHFRLTGEGIETEQQWNALQELGFHFAQGFLIAHPMPGDQIEGWIGKMTEIGRYRLAGAPG